jgi:hypothetical protein
VERLESRREVQSLQRTAHLLVQADSFAAVTHRNRSYSRLDALSVSDLDGGFHWHSCGAGLRVPSLFIHAFYEEPNS